MITAAFIQKLLATPAVTALVGKRISPNIIKPGTEYPAIYVFSDRMEKQGCYQSKGAMEGIIEIGVYAKSYPEAYELMKAIRDTLDDFTGIIDNVGVLIMSGREVADQHDEESEVHVKIIEYDAVAEPK